jgi:hypothetical protein
LAVSALVAANTIDDEFVADVLAVDFTNPALSKARCNLLMLVPAEPTADWRERFTQSLTASSDAAAKDLAANLTTTARTGSSHRQRATQFLAACRDKLKARSFVTSALRLVQQRRDEVTRNDISSSKNGQILEPGFRVIFPLPEPRAPGELKLSEACEIGA